MAAPIQSKHWDRTLPILNQGDLGSCTANAGTGALGTEPYWSRVGRKVVPADAVAAEQFAVSLYTAATHVDPWPGSYPPEDTGSSGLAVCKVLRSRGIISGYRWATTAQGLARLLQDGPVLLGMPWHEAFMEPAPGGWIEHGDWRRSPVVGGHEVEIVGVEVDGRDMTRSVLTLTNSWGVGWADRGFFRMRLSTYMALKDCDLKQFVVAAQ